MFRVVKIIGGEGMFEVSQLNGGTCVEVLRCWGVDVPGGEIIGGEGLLAVIHLRTVVCEVLMC